MQNTKQALVVIDVQNDYFPGGKLPLWNAPETLGNIVRAANKARQRGLAVILVQHVSEAAAGPGFFIDGSEGVNIHAELLKAVPGAPVVVKRFADAFKETRLNEVLDSLGVEEVLFCGMQTQNCVGLSAISKQAVKFTTAILADCCTAETQMVHRLALAGFGDRVPVTDSATALGE